MKYGDRNIEHAYYAHCGTYLNNRIERIVYSDGIHKAVTMLFGKFIECLKGFVLCSKCLDDPDTGDVLMKKCIKVG